ncbi:MAG: hypothetical protein ACREV2_12785 [Burkholderiales bacterium]
MPGTTSGVGLPKGVGPEDGTYGPPAPPEVEHCVGCTGCTVPVVPEGTYCRNEIVERVRELVVVVTDPLAVAGVPLISKLAVAVLVTGMFGGVAAFAESAERERMNVIASVARRSRF